MKICVIIATYNEIENIARLVTHILELPCDLEVLVVDDNSPDGTGEAVKALASKDKRVNSIHRAGKLGLGTAHIAGFKWAVARRFDLILTMDADFSHHPRYIPALLKMAENNHVSIGSRYVPGGGTENWGSHRKLLSWTANRFARYCVGLKANDCTAGFRCYHLGVLQALELDLITSDGYSFLVEMAFECQQRDCSFGEIPIIFTNRALGTSKISHVEIGKAIFTVWRLTFRRLVSHFQAKPAPVKPLGTIP